MRTARAVLFCVLVESNDERPRRASADRSDESFFLSLVIFRKIQGMFFVLQTLAHNSFCTSQTNFWLKGGEYSIWIENIMNKLEVI